MKVWILFMYICYFFTYYLENSYFCAVSGIEARENSEIGEKKLPNFSLNFLKKNPQKLTVLYCENNILWFWKYEFKPLSSFVVDALLEALDESKRLIAEITALTRRQQPEVCHFFRDFFFFASTSKCIRNCTFIFVYFFVL